MKRIHLKNRLITHTREINIHICGQPHTPRVQMTGELPWAAPLKRGMVFNRAGSAGYQYMRTRLRIPLFHRQKNNSYTCSLFENTSYTKVMRVPSERMFSLFFSMVNRRQVYLSAVQHNLNYHLHEVLPTEKKSLS